MLSAFSVTRTCRAILLISAPYNNYHTFGLSYSVRIVWLHTSNTLIFNSSPHSSPLFIPPSLHFFLNPSCRQSPAIPSKDYTSYCDDPMCLSPGKNNHTTTDTLTAVLAPNKSPVLNQWNKIHVQCVSSWFYYQHRNHKFKNIPFSAVELCCVYLLLRHVQYFHSNQRRQKDCWFQEAC